MLFTGGNGVSMEKGGTDDGFTDPVISQFLSGVQLWYHGVHQQEMKTATAEEVAWPSNLNQFDVTVGRA